MTTTHGMFGTPVYAVWTAMLQRCRNPAHHAYASYGGRGITVCKRWYKFENFYADMGEPNSLTLERKNNALGYSKRNCLWASQKEQCNNRRSCVQITYRGMTQNVTQWADALGIPRGIIYDRLRAGWQPARIFSTPKGPTGPAPYGVGPNKTGHCEKGK